MIENVNDLTWVLDKYIYWVGFYIYVDIMQPGILVHSTSISPLLISSVRNRYSANLRRTCQMSTQSLYLMLSFSFSLYHDNKDTNFKLFTSVLLKQGLDEYATETVKSGSAWHNLPRALDSYAMWLTYDFMFACMMTELCKTSWLYISLYLSTTIRVSEHPTSSEALHAHKHLIIKQTGDWFSFICTLFGLSCYFLR